MKYFASRANYQLISIGGLKDNQCSNQAGEQYECHYNLIAKPNEIVAYDLMITNASYIKTELEILEHCLELEHLRCVTTNTRCTRMTLCQCTSLQHLSVSCDFFDIKQPVHQTMLFLKIKKNALSNHSMYDTSVL